MKKNFLLATFVFLLGLLVFGLVYYLTRQTILYTIAISFGTTFYHFAMRLVIGYIIDTKFHNHMDDTKKWFWERSFEPRFYKIIRVKRWKKWIPTFQPEDFLLEKHLIADMIQVTCQAEIIHEIIMVFSFVPVIFSVWFGALEVFIITSAMACLFDSIFVIVQRYNRPRLMRLK